MTRPVGLKSNAFFDVTYLLLSILVWVFPKTYLPIEVMGGGLLVGYALFIWATRRANLQNWSPWNTPLLDQIWPSMAGKSLAQSLVSLLSIGHVIIFPMMIVAICANIISPRGIDGLENPLKTLLGFGAVFITIASWIALSLLPKSKKETPQPTPRYMKWICLGVGVCLHQVIAHMLVANQPIGQTLGVALYVYLPFRYWVERFSGVSKLSAIFILLNIASTLGVSKFVLHLW